MGCFFCRRQSSLAICNSYTRKTRQQKQQEQQKIEEEKPKVTENSTGLRSFSYEELESATNGFSSERLLGKGSNGSVYKAVLDNGKLVAAVKKLWASSLSPDENNPGDNEIEILSKIQHPGLVNLLGFGVDPNERKLTVVEFMSKGTLYDNLHCNSRLPRWRKRLRFAFQIAKAIEALHSSNPPVIHRDIKSSNVLIDENWNAKLGDFGLALRGHVEDVRMRSTPPAGTMGYLDPGYLTPQNLSTKSDIFSFGILLLEIISGRNAIDVNYSPPSLVEWAKPLIKQGKFNGLYDPRVGPPRDPFVRWQLVTLAARCVRSSAERRPPMAEVVDCLWILSKRSCLPIWNRLANHIKKLALVEKEIDTSSNFTEAVEEIPMSLKFERRNSSRNGKVSDARSDAEFTEELSGLHCSSFTEMTD